MFLREEFSRNSVMIHHYIFFFIFPHSSLLLPGLFSTSPAARQAAHQQKAQGLRTVSWHEELPAQQKSM